VIGVSALATAVSLRFAGLGGSGLGLGALTSLTVIGPTLDLALRRARSNRAVYFGFMLAGLAVNLVALAVRGGLKGVGVEHVGGRPLSFWLPQALVTYPVCGLAAGMASAFVWFYFRPPRRSQEPAR
jgi:hypothetical protein